jgi:hypothetical protein
MSYIVGTGAVWRGVGPLVGVRGSYFVVEPPRKNNFVVPNLCRLTN